MVPVEQRIERKDISSVDVLSSADKVDVVQLEDGLNLKITDQMLLVSMFMQVYDSTVKVKFRIKIKKLKLHCC